MEQNGTRELSLKKLEERQMSFQKYSNSQLITTCGTVAQEDVHV